MGSSIRGNLFLRELCLFSPFLRRSGCAPPAVLPSTAPHIAIGGIRCAAARSSDGGSQGKTSARFSLMKQVLQDAEERALSAGSEPTPKISLEHVTISYARSGGPGGQNVNKVNTKVDMRFNVKKAYWLSERVRDRILQMEKNRINKDGELVISSTKTRTQKGNIDDALEKLQGIIDAASYVPPPPSEEQKKRIEKLAAIGEQKRLLSKKLSHRRRQLEGIGAVGINPVVSGCHDAMNKSIDDDEVQLYFCGIFEWAQNLYIRNLYPGFRGFKQFENHIILDKMIVAIYYMDSNDHQISVLCRGDYKLY